METQITLEEFLCRVFPRTLKGNPYYWFIDLSFGSIMSFANLTLKFITQHICNVHIKKSSNILMTIKKINDILCHYTKRFLETMIDISNLETNMTIHGFHMELLYNSLLAINLSIQKLRTLPNFLTRKKLYIEVEELQ